MICDVFYDVWCVLWSVWCVYDLWFMICDVFYDVIYDLWCVYDAYHEFYNVCDVIYDVFCDVLYLWCLWCVLWYVLWSVMWFMMFMMCFMMYHTNYFIKSRLIRYSMRSCHNFFIIEDHTSEMPPAINIINICYTALRALNNIIKHIIKTSNTSYITPAACHLLMLRDREIELHIRIMSISW